HGRLRPWPEDRARDPPGRPPRRLHPPALRELGQRPRPQDRGRSVLAGRAGGPRPGPRRRQEPPQRPAGDAGEPDQRVYLNGLIGPTAVRTTARRETARTIVLMRTRSVAPRLHATAPEIHRREDADGPIPMGSTVSRSEASHDLVLQDRP